MIQITRHEGVRSLWSGLPPTLWVDRSSYTIVPATLMYCHIVNQSSIVYHMALVRYAKNVRPYHELLILQMRTVKFQIIHIYLKNSDIKVDACWIYAVMYT